MSTKATAFLIQYSIDETVGKGLEVLARQPIKKKTVVWRHVKGVFVVYDEPAFMTSIGKQQVAEALFDDRYLLVATRDIETGEALCNDYSADDECPAYYDALYMTRCTSNMESGRTFWTIA